MLDKKKLKSLRALNATRAMMYKAQQDVPKVKRRYYGNSVEYKHPVYMRVQMLDGFMKVAFFLVGMMRQGHNKPVYELFISPATGEFITWDCELQRWSEAKIDNLKWPEYKWYTSNCYINNCGYSTIKTVLNVSKGGWAGILEYQNNVRKEELKRKHRRETDPWDLDMEQIPALPKDWEHWVNKTAIQENFIFYQYKRGGAKEGWCTYCEKWVPIKEPRHNAAGKCKVCHKPITYKSAGKAGRFNTKMCYVYLMQKCEDGFVIREFEAYRHYQKNMYGMPGTEHYRAPEIRINEYRRCIYHSALLEPKSYNWREYKDHTMRWCKSGYPASRYSGYYGNYSYYSPSYYDYSGAVYKRTLKSLEKELCRTGVLEYINGLPKADPEEYLKAYKTDRIIEQMSKAGLTQLVYENIRKAHSRFEFPSSQSGKLTKVLEIDSFRLKRLKEMNGGNTAIKWLKYEKKLNTQYPDACIQYFDSKKINPKDVQFILDRMTVVKLCNYLKKQEPLCQGRFSWISNIWQDYLKMAKRVKMDVTKEIFYKPQNIKEAHDRLIEYMEENGLSIKAAEIADKYPNVEEILAELKEKYSFEDKKFAIIIPEKIEDMLNESNALSLCMDRDDRYYERISIRETYIAFLRKQSEPEQPWYVIEFEPNGTLRQESTVGDNKNKDFDEAIPFIKKWQRELSKRITKEDRELAKKSVELRLKEFEQLRKDKNQIRRGPLQGQLLIDVLEQRLMEVEENVG